MELVTLKQYAKEHKISYEAVRKQVIRYSEELSDHIIKQDRTQYLDPWAVKFLTEKRRESPIVLMNMDQDEENQRLKEEVESLKAQLMTAQNELLKSQDERLKAQNRIIELQDEAKKTLEDRAKYTALLEDNKVKEEKLKDAEDREANLSSQIRMIKTETEDLRRKAEADREKIEALQRERDEAQKEARSFTRSIFGFYRKK